MLIAPPPPTPVTTPVTPSIHIDDCTVKRSRNAGGFTWATCTTVTEGTSGPVTVRYRSNLATFNPGTPGPWRKTTGTVSAGGVLALKFAFKDKSVAQVTKSLKITLSGAQGATITDGTATAAAASS